MASRSKADGPSGRGKLGPAAHAVGERRANGKALRTACPRKSHGTWAPAAKRADPIDLLVASGTGRLQHLLPIRYGRMLASPLAFFRGAASIMAADLAHTPASGIELQVCGDCHLLNFGGFATPERRLVFDINDFDETLVAPWEWDLKRLAASFALAGRHNGFSADDCREAAWWVGKRYRERMAEFAAQPVLDLWYASIDYAALVDMGTDKEFRDFGRRNVSRARAKSSHDTELAKLTHGSAQPVRIADDPPLIYHEDELQHPHHRQALESAYGQYLKSLAPHQRQLLDRFSFADMAIKVVGVGSVGTLCGIALFMAGNGDPLFLQFKQAGRSVLEPYAKASPYRNGGERVVTGQRIMQSASDAFLGWTVGTRGQHLYLRQLRDAKIKPAVELMKPANLKGYARACAWALALAHSRSGDPVLLNGYLGQSAEFDDALADFAFAYADQTERDHAALVSAVRSGRIEARTDVL